MFFIHRHNPYPLRRSDLQPHVLDREALLYDEKRKTTHRLNDTAFFIWQHCDATKTAADIARLMTETYNAPVGQIEADVQNAIDVMTRYHLLKRCSRPRQEAQV